MNTSSRLDSTGWSTTILIILLLAVVAMWYWLPPYLASEITEPAQRGVYGDSFGSVNSLFTGLAFAALIFTILLQQREIKLQREDLKSQMEEMRESRKELARQGDLQQKQIALDSAALEMKILEVRIAEIEMEAMKWEPGLRYQYVRPMFDAVQEQMQDILNTLHEQDA